MSNVNQNPAIALRYVALSVLVAFAIGFVVGWAVGKKYNPCVNVPVVSITRDTVIKRDTIKGKVTAPTIRTIIRVDTLTLPSTPDTTLRRDTSRKASLLPDGRLRIPIEQRKYVSADYTAYVSGYNPALDSITLYPKVKTITNTVTKVLPPPRKFFTLAAGPSLVYGADKVVRPGISLTLGLNIKSW